MESVVQLSEMLSAADIIVGLGPFVAAMMVALIARKSNPRAGWLTFAGCLIVLVGYLGHNTFLALPHWYGDDAAGLVNAAVDVIQGLLDTASVALLVLAIATVLRARRGPAGESRTHGTV